MSELAAALCKPFITLKDADGKEHKLGALTLGDLADLEVLLGASVSKWAYEDVFSAEGEVSLLWVLLRKEGMTRDQVLSAKASTKWPISMECVGEMFEMRQLKEVAEAVTKVMKASGLSSESEGSEKSADPTTKAVEAGSGSAVATAAV